MNEPKSVTTSPPEKVLHVLVPATMAVLSGAVMWFYMPVLTKLFSQLAASEDYSFGLVLPLVSGYIVYLKIPQVRQCLWRPSWLGLFFMGAGLVLYVAGELAADLYLPRLSFVVVLSGLSFLMGGRRLFRLLMFPLFLLVLMFPLPGLVTKQLTLPLQLISSRLATKLLQLSGIPAFCQGNVIDLGFWQMQVVEACSGLRYILALFALGVIFCYFFQRRPWKVAVLLSVLIPCAIVANAFRVMGMGIFPALHVEGFWHAFSGWLIFIFCLGILSIINWLLNKLQPDPDARTARDAGDAAHPKRLLVVESYLLAGLALVCLGGPLAGRVAQAPATALRQGFDKFPLELGPWQGRHVRIDPEMVKATQSNAHLNADFTNPGSPPVSLWIAFYESQKKAGGFVHTPKLCLTGGGWSQITAGTDRLGEGRAVNYILLEQMGNRMVVYYWYMQRGRWVTSEYLNKLYMGLDGLTRRRTDGALIRLITSAEPSPELARQRLAALARLLEPVLPEFIPD